MRASPSHWVSARSIASYEVEGEGVEGGILKQMKV